MNWYLTVVRDNYANFSGRARRSEYWYFVLCSMIISIVLSFVLPLILGFFGLIISMLYSAAVLIPSLAVAVRRLHDIGKSGAFLLLAFVPLLNIWLLILLATEGTQGPNQYGEDPKNQHPDISEIGTANNI